MNQIARISFFGIALFGLLLFPQRAQSQWALLDARADTIVRNGLGAMYNLRYPQADSIFNSMIKLYPDHPAGYFLLALVDWWRIVPNIDVDSKVDRYSESFNKRIDRTLQICEDRLEKNPIDIVGLFFKGSALGYRARLNVSKNFSPATLGAITDGKEAYQIILQCQRMAPSNSDVLLGSGLYNYMAAYIPQQYPWASSFVSFLGPGDRQLGIQMLRISGKRAAYANVEARYSLMEILSNFEKDYPAGLDVAKELYAQYPFNPVFHKYLAKNYYMTNDFTNADSAWTEILRRVKRHTPGYEITLARQGLYYLGDIRLREGKLDDARRFFEQAARQSERIGEDETSWIVQSTLKLGNVYDALGERKKAINQYEEVLDMEEYSNSHTKAKGFIAAPYR